MQLTIIQCDTRPLLTFLIFRMGGPDLCPPGRDSNGATKPLPDPPGQEGQGWRRLWPQGRPRPGAGRWRINYQGKKIGCGPQPPLPPTPLPSADQGGGCRHTPRGHCGRGPHCLLQPRRPLPHPPPPGSPVSRCRQSGPPRSAPPPPPPDAGGGGGYMQRGTVAATKHTK